MNQTPEYKKAMQMMAEVAPEAFRNIKIWNEDIHGALTGENIARLIRKNYELHSMGAPFWRAIATIADFEIFQATRPVENLAVLFNGPDHCLAG